MISTQYVFHAALHLVYIRLVWKTFFVQLNKLSLILNVSDLPSMFLQPQKLPPANH